MHSEISEEQGQIARQRVQCILGGVKREILVMGDLWVLGSRKKICEILQNLPNMRSRLFLIFFQSLAGSS